MALTAEAGQACTRGEHALENPNPAARRQRAAAVTSPAADRQISTLTGCLRRGVEPGVYNLMSVATAGVLDSRAAQT